MISAGDIVPLTIDKPAAGGRMIARAGRLVVLVSGAIPGEQVRARIERLGKGVAYAAAVDIAAASPDRRDSAADPSCGGCLYAHIGYPRQLELKSQVISDAFARIAHLRLPDTVRIAPSREDGYRMRARLHVRGRVAGFFREGTHEVCDARQTRQLLPATLDAVDRLVAAIDSLHLENVREIEVAENAEASQRAVHLDAAGLNTRSLEQLSAIDGLTGLSSPAGTSGDVHVTDTIVADGREPVLLGRHVLAFFQGNRYLINQLVGHVMNALPLEGDVIDLYAGVGLFSVMAAATHGVRVTAVEGDRIAASDLTANAEQTDGALHPIHQSVEEFVRKVQLQAVPDRPGPTVIVDPPRTGMSREALDGICRMNPPRIVYVSCDVATLARDARRLVDGGYLVARVDGFDLFPNTPHVETVAVFDRSSDRGGLR